MEKGVEKSLEEGVEKGGSTLLEGAGLTIFLTLTPIKTGNELTPQLVLVCNEDG